VAECARDEKPVDFVVAGKVDLLAHFHSVTEYRGQHFTAFLCRGLQRILDTVRKSAAESVTHLLVEFPSLDNHLVEAEFELGALETMLRKSATESVGNVTIKICSSTGEQVTRRKTRT
jgi:hypothetical protein